MTTYKLILISTYRNKRATFYNQQYFSRVVCYGGRVFTSGYLHRISLSRLSSFGDRTITNYRGE